MLRILRLVLTGLRLAFGPMLRPGLSVLTRPAAIRKRTDGWNAQRIEIHNHLYQCKNGDTYRCIWCGRESLAITWADVGNICPLCKRRYDPVQVYDMEE